MNRNRIWFIVLGIAVGVMIVTTVGITIAQGEQIPRFTIGGGGGQVGTSQIALRSGFGQPIAGSVQGSSSDSSQLCAGFECGPAQSSSSTTGTPTPTVTSTSSSTTPQPTATPTATSDSSSSTATPTATATQDSSSSTATPTATATVDPSSPTATPTATSQSPSGSSSDIVISEVYYLGDSNSDWIELRNTGNGTIDISEWWFCALFSYKQLSDNMTIIQGDLVLSPGEFVVLQAWTDLNNSESDLALYTDDNGNSPDFGSTSFMVDFIQWGTPNDVGRSDVAAAKGIWPEISSGQYDFVATASNGQSTALVSNNSGTAGADFRNGAPTQGQANQSTSGGAENPIYLPLVVK